MRIRPAVTLPLLIALVAGVVALSAPSPAEAAKPCWKRVIDDWLDDGALDGTYKVSCLEAALKNVPEDLRDYSNVTDVINAAMQARISGGGGGGNGNPSSGDSGSDSDANGNGEKARKPQSVDDSYYRRAIDNLGTTSADSVPIPLLVLASIGGLLLLTAAGMVGARRIKASRAKRVPPPAT